MPLRHVPPVNGSWVDPRMRAAWSALPFACDLWGNPAVRGRAGAACSPIVRVPGSVGWRLPRLGFSSTRAPLPA